MAWAFISNRGSATSKTSGTTVTVNPTATIAAGRILAVLCVSDDDVSSGPTHNVADSGGNSYAQLSFSSGSSNAASSTVSLHASRIVQQLTTGSTVTLTLGSARTAKVIGLQEFSVTAGYSFSLAGQNSAGGSGTSPSVALSGLSAVERLWLGVLGVEGPVEDSFTQDTFYANAVLAGTTGSGASSNIALRSGTRISSLTGDTYDPTITSRDYRVLLAALIEAAPAGALLESSVSGTGVAAGPLTTEKPLVSSVSGAVTATATELTGASLLVGAVSCTANSASRLTLPQEEIYGSWSNHLENEFIKHLFRTGSFTKPTELWVSLHTDDLQDDATGAEVTGGSYSRVQLNPGDSNWAAVGAGGTNALTYNLIQLTFPTPTASWGRVGWAGIWDAQTAGNLLFHSVVNPAITINSGELAPRINVGDLQVSINVPPISEFISLNGDAATAATASGNIEQSLFADGFESNTFLTTDTPPGQWTSLYLGSGGYAPVIQSTIKHAGTYAYDQEFFATNNDLQRYARKDFTDFGYPSGLSHYFIRGYLYQKTPESDTTPSAKFQGKLIRLWSSLTNYTPATGDNEVEILAWNAVGGVYSPTTRYISLGYYGLSDTFVQVDNIGTYGYDVWVCLEMEVQLNTPGAADGVFRLWVNGTKTYENLAIALRGNSTKNTLWAHVGNQINITVGTAHEHRYWDDVRISTAYIGL